MNLSRLGTRNWFSLLALAYFFASMNARADSFLTADQRVAEAIDARDVKTLHDALRAGGKANGQVQLPGQPYPIDQQRRALETGDVEVVASLLDAGADLTVGISEAGCQPKIIQLYLDRGVAVDTHPLNGMPLLWDVVEKGIEKVPGGKWTEEQDSQHTACLRTASYLVAHGAKFQGYRNSKSPLSEAVASGDVEFLQVFVNAGADFNERPEPLIFTALYWYAISTSTPQMKQQAEQLKNDLQSLKTIEFMLKHGANPNLAECGSYDGYEDSRRFPFMDGETPLMVAARYGWYDMAKLLLENGADPLVGRKEIEKDEPIIPSDIASTSGHTKTATLIKDFEKHSKRALAPAEVASSPTFAECF